MVFNDSSFSDSQFYFLTHIWRALLPILSNMLLILKAAKFIMPAAYLETENINSLFLGIQ